MPRNSASVTSVKLSAAAADLYAVPAAAKLKGNRLRLLEDAYQKACP